MPVSRFHIRRLLPLQSIKGADLPASICRSAAPYHYLKKTFLLHLNHFPEKAISIHGF
ncbi:hypothetical protein CLOSTASPAR_04690 [[Clostridium] asparagiforme DSM 15981]|uniref:Uncharacterized protein n=1 Tax=[Clostridium] asparagiforme DSM 15981 TaxID=518636 RepID=C0D5Z5_9FIRM|nr:hypothetical protein CLOSTASPAR_04690 [[Clostridium] asparagiforme DSM 15981]